MKLEPYEQQLLDGWEEVYKKGQLTLWILLALYDGPKHMTQIKLFIDHATQKTMNADDQSMYRALRRYHDAELVSFALAPGESGPELKVYSLTNIGGRVLSVFVERNITNIWYRSDITSLIKGVN